MHGIRYRGQLVRLKSPLSNFRESLRKPRLKLSLATQSMHLHTTQTTTSYIRGMPGAVSGNNKNLFAGLSSPLLSSLLLFTELSGRSSWSPRSKSMRDLSIVDQPVLTTHDTRYRFEGACSEREGKSGARGHELGTLPELYCGGQKNAPRTKYRVHSSTIYEQRTSTWEISSLVYVCLQFKIFELPPPTPILRPTCATSDASAHWRLI
jgi:hypothetical protein